MRHPDKRHDSLLSVTEAAAWRAAEARIPLGANGPMFERSEMVRQSEFVAGYLAAADAQARRTIPGTMHAPTPAEARVAGMALREEDRTLRARGMVHELVVMPNGTFTGWIVSVHAPSAGANLPQEQAEVLARHLLAGPGEDPRPTCRHGRALADICTDCLAD